MSNNEKDKKLEDAKWINTRLNMIEQALIGTKNKYNKEIIPKVSSIKYKNKIIEINNQFDEVNKIIKMQGLYNVDSINNSDMLDEYIKQYNELQKKVFRKLKFRPKSDIDEQHVSLFKKFYWVIPYNYKKKDLRHISNIASKKQFDEYIINYFTDDKVKKMFKQLKSQYKVKNKRTIIEQIKHSYYQEHYATCITTIITLFDSTTLALINKNSTKQHNSHNIISAIQKNIENDHIEGYIYELYLKINILNNFISKLYKPINKLKEASRITTLSRHINSHGVYYSNKKIDALRLLNALVYSNELIKDLNLNDSFTEEKNNFIIKN